MFPLLVSLCCILSNFFKSIFFFTFFLNWASCAISKSFKLSFLTVIFLLIKWIVFLSLPLLFLSSEMATHSSVLAWRIPGTEEPHGLPSMGSHRVEHDWSDLAAVAAASRSHDFKDLSLKTVFHLIILWFWPR